jgi:enoyl-CoA hydratase/carnithine racemase
MSGANGRSYELIEVAGPEGVPYASARQVTLNNPARRNAIGPQMVNELLYALEDAFSDDAVRSVVLTGAGEKAFCAGGDFKQMGGGNSELEPKGDYADLLLMMQRAPKPIVARVNGHAMGGGLGLVAASHFAVGVSTAKLGTPEIDVGLFPMMIMAVLARLVPRRRLIKMMLYGERLTAAEAAELQILGEVVESEELDGAVGAICETIASKSPITVKLGLEAFAAQDDMDLQAALPMLQERLGACLATEDAQEGLMAFLQKREPVWKGR